MDETKAPSQEYRQKLAQDLIELRKSNRDDAKDLLEQEKETHIYKLSKVLKLNQLKVSRFNKSEFDENINEASQSHNTVSNEASLYETF